jgi:hypothetical protein
MTSGAPWLIRTARSIPQESRYFGKALGERQHSSIWAKFARLVRINSSADGLNISIGEMWMWQSVSQSSVASRRKIYEV